jgi:hypothetical protein
MEQRRSRPEQRQPALGAPGTLEEVVERSRHALQHPIEHGPQQTIAGTEGRHAGRRGRRGRQQHRVEDRGRPRDPEVHGGRLGERVDPVQQDEVVSRQQFPQPPVVSLAIGELEVAKDGDLLHRTAFSGACGHAGDPPRIGMRAGDLHLHARLRQGGPVHRPTDRGHVVATLDQASGERGERSHVAGGTDGRQGNPHQIVAIRRGAMRGPKRGATTRPTSR